MRVFNATETHLSFSFGRNDWHFGRAEAFLEEFRRDVPRPARKYDGEAKCWRILRLYEGQFYELKEKHFAAVGQPGLFERAA